MLKLIRTTLNKKQTDFVNENRAIINKRLHYSDSLKNHPKALKQLIKY